MKHGIGKGLMTVWRATNPDGGDFPTGINVSDGEVANISPISTSMSQKKPLLREKRPRQKVPVAVSHLLQFIFFVNILFYMSWYLWIGRLCKLMVWLL